jgi:UDP-glucose 4-epimerase
MKILVTGGAGFIASQIAQTYIDQGHQVVVLDNLSSGNRAFVPTDAQFIEMDILDPEVEKLFQEEKFDAINHHAAQISVTGSVRNPLNDAKTNILGTLHLLQKAVESGVEKFIFASTGGAIYGDQERFPADETHSCDPYSPYGIAKYSAEHYIRFFIKTYNLSGTVLRYSNVYGPRQDPDGEAGVVAIFCKRILEGKPLIVYGDGEQTRDFISVRDIVAANIIALSPQCQGIYNVGRGEETTVNHLAKSLAHLAGATAGIQYAEARAGEQKRSCIDPEKFNTAFGWRAHVTLEKGLFETLEYFKTLGN